MYSSHAVKQRISCIGPTMQTAERDMVTMFKQRGWDAFMLHPTFGALKAGGLPFRHGVTVMQRYIELKTSWD